MTWRTARVTDSGAALRDHVVDATDCVTAYAKTRSVVERLYLSRSPNTIVCSLKQEDRRITSPEALAALSTEELAYVVWRMHFEQKSCPALLTIQPHVRSILISAGVVPGDWWAISKRLWTLAFRASYASLLIDVSFCLSNGMAVSEIFRMPVSRNYFVLPRSATRDGAGGLLVYPMLRAAQSELLAVPR